MGVCGGACMVVCIFPTVASLPPPPQAEALYVDPYTDPQYEIQAQKYVDKAERDRVRAAAAEAKEERCVAHALPPHTSTNCAIAGG